jgi:hypothetical protein
MQTRHTWVKSDLRQRARASRCAGNSPRKGSASLIDKLARIAQSYVS